MTGKNKIALMALMVFGLGFLGQSKAPAASSSGYWPIQKPPIYKQTPAEIKTMDAYNAYAKRQNAR